MYEHVCYRESYLKEVIIRVDFTSPIEKISSGLPSSISREALQRFPISEPKKGLAQELQLSPEAIHHLKREFTEWNFFGRDREKQLQITPPSLWISYNKYHSFENLKRDFLSVLNSFFTQYPDVTVSRIGLRYINQIEPPNTNPFDWGNYIDAQLLGLFSRFTDRSTVTRLFNIVELKFDDLQLKFQFGAPNPDYPAAIRRPQFILDLDGYVQGLQDYSDVGRNIDRAHAQIQSIFEESITDGLRGIMNG